MISIKARLKKFDLRKYLRFKNKSLKIEGPRIHNRFIESCFTTVAYMLLSEGKKVRSWSNNLEILNVACEACCRSNFHVAMEEKYGVFPRIST